VNEAVKPASSQDSHIRASCGRIGSPLWWVLVQRPVWPVDVAVIDVLAEDEPAFAADAGTPGHQCGGVCSVTH